MVVGPNGCGKSNILDAVSWVLGEQSAKTLRGTHMQDVIFAGTRERKALGMAEVTLTMVDPEAYEGPVPVEPQVTIDHESPTDWDEEEARRARAAEVEEIIANEQPGQVLDDEAAEGPEPPQTFTTGEGPQAVVLKIRRRKFQRTPQKGEIVITRRLFRTGESEYLLNGKLCRLRDIQDIFMGTGLGPVSYTHLDVYKRQMPRHTDEERPIVAVVRRPPVLRGRHQGMEVPDHGIQVEALKLFGVIECLAHGIGKWRVLVQDLEVQLIGPPVCVRWGSSRCVFQSAVRKRAFCIA